MKYLVLSAFVFCCLLSHSQKGDEKILKQVAAQITKHDFQKAVINLERISDAGKTETSFLQSASLVYDSLQLYSKAITAYELLLNGSDNNNAIIERISILRNEIGKNDEAERMRLEKMKDCTKCNGSGYFQTKETCAACNGYKTVTKDCIRCHGDGKLVCIPCEGTGYIRSDDPKKLSGSCNRCGGGGYLNCTAMCNRGKVTEACRKCSSSGEVSIKNKCDLH